MGSRSCGFTVIELMIVLSIIAVLIVVAAPSMRTMIISNQLRSVSGDLQSDMSIARSEASKLSQRVVICASSDQDTCTSGSAWSAGWIVFVDANNNGQRATSGTAEPLIRIREAIPASIGITAPGVSALSFRAIGIVNTASNFTICPTTAATGVPGRSINMNALGRVQTINIACP